MEEKLQNYNISTMRKNSLFVFLFFVFSNAFGQEINLALKNELKEIQYWDQIYREYFDNFITSARKKEISNELTKKGIDVSKLTWESAVAMDSINLKKVETIFKKYGYPGKSLVGTPENETAWYVVQHSDKIDKYLPLMKEAGKKGEIKFTFIATMEDRNLMYQGKEQIYGTQGSGKFWEEDGKQFKTEFIWPIKDAKNVNKKRKEAGFDVSIEEYAKEVFGKDFVYKEYTLKDIDDNKIEKQEVK